MLKVISVVILTMAAFACSDNIEDANPAQDASLNDGGQSDAQTCKGVQCSGKGTCSPGPLGPMCKCNTGYQAYGPACLKLGKELVAWWRMDEPAGTKTAADASGNGHSGVVTDLQSGVNGVWGRAFSFKDGLVTVAPSNTLDKLTKLSTTLWLKPSALPTGPPKSKDFFFIVTRREPPPDGVDTWRVAIGGGSLAFSAETESDDQHGTTPRTDLNIGKWNHLGATFDGVNIKLYLDGKLASSTPAKHPLKVDSPASIYIGNNYTQQRGFEGVLDEVRIFDRALTAAEVKAEYDALCLAGVCNP